MTSHRILYAGDDTNLPTRLTDGLGGLDCFVVYSPVGIARMLIGAASNTHYYCLTRPRRARSWRLTHARSRTASARPS